MKSSTNFLGYQRLLLLVGTYSALIPLAKGKKDLYIGIFVSLNNDKPVKGWNSHSLLPGLEMALHEVNNHCKILGNYNVTAVWKDEKVT